MTDPEVMENELRFPELLRSLLNAFSDVQIRRKALVFLDGSLLPVPGYHYHIDSDSLVLLNPIKDTTVVTICVQVIDERWYYSARAGWGRL